MEKLVESTPTVISGAIEITESLNGFVSGSDATKSALSVVGAVGEAVKPFVPLIGAVTLLISEIIVIYENAQYNKRICNSLMDRVGAAEQAIKSLQRRKAENEKRFKNAEYYKNFVRFVDVLKRIKGFIKDVSELQGYKKFFHSGSIKEKFDSLVKEFENVMGDLHFTMAVADEEQRRLDHEALEQDISDMNKFLEQIKGGIVDNTNTLNTVLQEVLIMKGQIEHISDISKVNLPNSRSIKAVEINPDELLDPDIKSDTDRRGNKPNYIYKKTYKVQEVACRPINIPSDDDARASRVQAHLAILGKLRDSPNILKFYGLSYLEGNRVMINEWAEMGTLREVYEKYDIAWTAKVHIATDICRGITFLHSCSILHHDIRCENILITRSLDPKITNFEYSRYTASNTTNMSTITEVVHWMAPEKLRPSKDMKPAPYTFKCEIFSFGMTLWELAFEKIPYEHWDMSQIKDHVVSGKREKISFGDASLEVQQIQQELKLIIVSAWQDDPGLRASLQQIFLQLSKLANIHKKPLSSPALLPAKTLDLDGSMKKAPVSVSDEGGTELPDLGDEFNIDAIEPVMPLEEGIAAHKKKDNKTAWECFEAHADLGNTTAKYWMGYYLWEGCLEGTKDRIQASKLFKEAADDGISDAQLRYAFSLVNNPPIKFDRKVFLEYLNKAADNNNPTAQFNLGDMYLNGKLKVEKDQKLGVKYLRLAALNNQPKAIEILNKIGINIYTDGQDE